MSSHERLSVPLGTRSYDILIGETLIGEAGALIKPVLKQPSVFVVTDEHVAEHHLGALARALDNAGIAHAAHVLPPGEETKSFRHLEQLVDWLLEQRIERHAALVALGGGVIGDLTGFAASVVLRGVDFIQIPTTLLAQVDSSVGGKTGINTPRGKNLVGTFHQPRLVLADTECLTTLPKREILAGYAEVVKYGLINDKAFFAWLESHGPSLLDGDPHALKHAISESCKAKAAIVAADERESGARALLNLGHTFAHAFEAESRYGSMLLHGEAVAIGMVMAFDLSAQLGHCSLEESARVRRHVAAVGLPTGLDWPVACHWSPQRLIEHMTRDKKVKDGRITFVLARGIGDAFLCNDVDPAQVRALLATSLAA